MNKKIIILIVIMSITVIGALFFIDYMFEAQYNSYGISHFLVVTIDKNQEKELIGKLDDHDVYIAGLKIDETNFRTIDAKNKSVKETIEHNLTSIEEWKKYARKIKKENGLEILVFDNYEIAITQNECIIRPRTK